MQRNNSHQFSQTEEQYEATDLRSIINVISMKKKPTYEQETQRTIDNLRSNQQKNMHIIFKGVTIRTINDPSS